MSILYVCYYGLKYYTMALVSLNVSKISDERFWNRLLSVSSNNFEEQKKILETFYWLNEGEI